MRIVPITILITAMLVISPLAIADENEDIPTNAANTGVHDSLVAALAQAELVATLEGEGPFTVFAPTDQAFTDAGIDLAALDNEDGKATLTDILTYHVYVGSVASNEVTDGMTAKMYNGDDVTFTVTDGVVKVGDATVTTADVMASNGIIHVIDKVLMPPADLVNIPTVAAGTGAHDSLVAALAQAELVATLEGEGPFTVFAPTDQAFTDAGIDLAALDNEDGKATLTDILTYHVYVGSVASNEVTDGMTAKMYNGDDVTFTVTDGVVKVGDATVTTADVMASNGIIHVIDKVLMPPAEDANNEVDDTNDSTAKDTSECDVIIGIDSTPAAMGMAYDKTNVNVMVGDTVCWIWEDESMAHNVAQVDSATSTTRKSNGVYSGESETTVDFRYTFTEDETFYYVCEPHVAQDMRGVITVGIGTVETPDKSNDAPGFGLAITMSALLLGLMFNSRRQDME